jgi:hypothetical protein
LSAKRYGIFLALENSTVRFYCFRKCPMAPETWENVFIIVGRLPSFYALVKKMEFRLFRGSSD